MPATPAKQTKGDEVGLLDKPIAAGCAHIRGRAPAPASDEENPLLSKCGWCAFRRRGAAMACDKRTRERTSDR